MTAKYRVLATRPVAQNPAWCERLEAAGFEALAIPLLAIEPLRETQQCQRIKHCIMDFDQYMGVIFVSQNAVHYTCDWLEQYWPQMPVKMQYFAVGVKTAACLRERMRACGAANIHVADNTMNSEALLAHPRLQQVAGQKLLICRGLGGRSLLADALAERGAEVDICELYRRCCPPAAQAQLTQQALEPERDILGVFSGETLTNAVTLAEQGGLLPRIRQLRILVPSERVAARARALGFRRILCAANASEDAMLNTLIDGLIENDYVGRK